MTLNDLECLIHLNVRLVDGTLDVRLLRFGFDNVRLVDGTLDVRLLRFGFDHTHKCSQRGWRGVGWRA